ncbi:hypothetical protein MYA98_21095 [Salmonella sp. WGH-01]|nr:hypothetical protein MYA98_21095 [Salmonella sp. WGH-01]
MAVLTLLLAYRWLNVASTTMASARLLHLPLLTDKLLRFAMIVYLCVPGMFIGISVVGMFYLQNVAQLSPAAAGSLMLPGRSLHLSPLCLPDVTSIGLGRVR